jgi:hypothetical protein
MMNLFVEAIESGEWLVLSGMLALALFFFYLAIIEGKKQGSVVIKRRIQQGIVAKGISPVSSRLRQARSLRSRASGVPVRALKVRLQPMQR